MEYYIVIATRVDTDEFLSVMSITTDYEEADEYTRYLNSRNDISFMQIHEYQLDDPNALVRVHLPVTSDEIQYSIVTAIQ